MNSENHITLTAWLNSLAFAHTSGMDAFCPLRCVINENVPGPQRVTIALKPGQYLARISEIAHDFNRLLITYGQTPILKVEFREAISGLPEGYLLWLDLPSDTSTGQYYVVLPTAVVIAEPLF